MKQNEGLNGYLNPEHKKTTNKTTMSPPQTKRRAIKHNVQKFINHTLVNNQICSLQQNITDVIFL